MTLGKTNHKSFPNQVCTMVTTGLKTIKSLGFRPLTNKHHKNETSLCFFLLFPCHPHYLHQFSSRWYLCAQESPYVLYHVTQKFPQCCLWNSPTFISLIKTLELAFSRPFKEDRLALPLSCLHQEHSNSQTLKQHTEMPWHITTDHWLSATSTQNLPLALPAPSWWWGRPACPLLLPPAPASCRSWCWSRPPPPVPGMLQHG